MRMTWWSAALWLSFAYSTAFCSAAFNISESVGSAETKGTVEETGRSSGEAPPPLQAAGTTLRVHSQSSGSRNASEMKHGHLTKHAHGALTDDAPSVHLSSVSDVPSEPASHLTNVALPANERLVEKPSFLQEGQSNITILVLVGACIVLFLIVVGILTHYALSLRARSRRGGVRDTKVPYGLFKAQLSCNWEQQKIRRLASTLSQDDGFEETNQVDSEPQGGTYESLPAAAPPASLESFNSLYNLPPGFIERKTPREIEYERRVMSRLLSRGDAPPSPRSQGRHLTPNADGAGFDRSASR